MEQVNGRKGKNCQKLLGVGQVNGENCFLKFSYLIQNKTKHFFQVLALPPYIACIPSDLRQVHMRYESDPIKISRDLRILADRLMEPFEI